MLAKDNKHSSLLKAFVNYSSKNLLQALKNKQVCFYFGNPLQPSLIIARKAIAYSSFGSWLYWSRQLLLANEKHSSLFVQGVSGEEKKFY
jgi:hypothetical protein